VSPSDYHFFFQFEANLAGQRFKNDGEVETVVTGWQTTGDTHFY
jgi:hypothetical protein